jgi:hypothetical protein
LQQKILAFQELSANFKGLVSLRTKLAGIIYYIDLPKKLLLNDELQNIIEKKFNAQESFKEFYDFIISFNLFSVRYRHLFDYEFKSKEFDSLFEETFNIEKKVNEFVEGSTRGIYNYDLLKKLVSDEYRDNFWKFVDKLRAEVNIKEIYEYHSNI